MMLFVCALATVRHDTSVEPEAMLNGAPIEIPEEPATIADEPIEVMSPESTLPDPLADVGLDGELADIGLDDEFSDVSLDDGTAAAEPGKSLGEKCTCRTTCEGTGSLCSQNACCEPGLVCSHSRGVCKHAVGSNCVPGMLLGRLFRRSGTCAVSTYGLTTDGYGCNRSWGKLTRCCVKGRPVGVQESLEHWAGPASATSVSAVVALGSSVGREHEPVRTKPDREGIKFDPDSCCSGAMRCLWAVATGDSETVVTTLWYTDKTGPWRPDSARCHCLSIDFHE